jgi:phosphoglycolate phosphatase-like HAD superfamily hydrolase
LKRRNTWKPGRSPAYDPDCLVFDVDGVLISSAATYKEVIRRLVEEEWRKLGFEADRPGYSSELNWTLKNHGSFNDDYDISWTLLNIAHTGNSKKLSEALPSPEELEKIISGCASSCLDWLPRHYEVKFDIATIRARGQDIFTGENGGAGVWKQDVPLLETDWKALPYPAYIYTGRDLKEWRLAQKTLNWPDFPDDRAVQVDMGIKKPSPEGLEYICRKFGHERPMYFGDTMSDKLSFDAFGQGWFVAIGDMLNGVELRFPDITAALASLIE